MKVWLFAATAGLAYGWNDPRGHASCRCIAPPATPLCTAWSRAAHGGSCYDANYGSSICKAHDMFALPSCPSPRVAPHHAVLHLADTLDSCVWVRMVRCSGGSVRFGSVGVRACVRACVHACVVRSCVRVCRRAVMTVCVRVWVRAVGVTAGGRARAHMQWFALFVERIAKL